MLAKIIICIVIPLLFFSVILKKDARHITLYLCIGTVACYIACAINTWLWAKIGCSFFYLTTTIAPIVEEFLKFIPILLMSYHAMDNMEKVFPSAVALGIGFAITENMYMLFQNEENLYIQWVILRGISTGLMHAMSAAIIALGVLEAKEHRELSLVGIIATVSLAMIYHGFFNCCVNGEGILKYIGVVIPIFTYTIVFLIYRKDVVNAVIADVSSDKEDKSTATE